MNGDLRKYIILTGGWYPDLSKYEPVKPDPVPMNLLGGDEYENNDFKLPSAPGRKWYEADINYGGGKRNRQRIVYSNDGLMFATYDHYQTFYEITQ